MPIQFYYIDINPETNEQTRLGGTYPITDPYIHDIQAFSIFYPGYKFVGWSTWSEYPTIIYYPGDTIEDDNWTNNLYSVWEEDPIYTLIFIGNGGLPEEMYIQLYSSEPGINIPEEVPIRENYSFIGWESDHNGEIYYPGDPFDNIYSDNCFTAKWEWNPINKISIKTQEGWKTGIPWIKTENGWQKGVPWIKTQKGWQKGI